MNYIVKKIQESDYGCEERPIDYKAKVVLTLRDESGGEIEMELLDEELYEHDINEGDWVYFDLDGQIIKEEI